MVLWEETLVFENKEENRDLPHFKTWSRSKHSSWQITSDIYNYSWTYIQAL